MERLNLGMLHFLFKKRNVLRNVDLTIESKKITAIVGKSGSGKSSILKLIARLYDPNEGQILIDKQDIKNISVSSLRSQIAIVPQSPMIFDGTIMENIRLANPDASEAEVKEACIKSDSLEFISKFKNGLNTLIGHGGITLSAGENQRIAIARALLKKAKILILDEPTTAVDIKSTHSIMDTLDRLKKDVTIVIVAHNISSTYGVDNTITIDDGVVVELFERTSVHNDLDTVTDYLYSLILLIEVFKEMSKENDKNIQLQTNTDHVQASNKFVDYHVIGTTPKKRRMDVVVIGKKIDPKLKIFIMAGQHGDEKLSRKAAEELVSHLIKNKGKEFPIIKI